MAEYCWLLAIRGTIYENGTELFASPPATATLTFLPRYEIVRCVFRRLHHLGHRELNWLTSIRSKYGQ
jgi:hypothetical protein